MPDSTSPALDLFLDTSAQFNRHSLDKESRQEIEGLLNSSRITGSSTYARLEFKMSFLRDLAYLHGKLRQLESIPHVLSHLSKLPPPHDRKLRRTLDHLARFWQNIPGDDTARMDAIILCIEQQVLSIWRWFDDSVDYLADGTGCVRSRESPRFHRGHLEVILKNCRRDQIRCRIHRFFTENRELFEKMASKIDSLAYEERTKELIRLQQVTDQASADATILCDDRICRKIGDALIGVDGKEFPSIVSSNAKEFRVISEAVGNNFIQIRPS